MKYLIDTCVISQLVKKRPEKSVIDWLSGVDESQLYISVFTLGELQKGVSRLKEKARQKRLQDWLDHDLKDRFYQKIIEFDVSVSLTWGQIQAKVEASGKKVPAIDGLIAASAITHDLTLVTQNTQDMKATGVVLFNPWEETMD